MDSINSGTTAGLSITTNADWPMDGSITLRAPNGQQFHITQNVQYKSLQQLPQQQQDELFLASVQKEDTVELPTYIFVETRFITKNTGEDFEQMELYGTSLMDAPRTLISPIDLLPKKKPLPVKTFANAAVSAGVVQTECGTMTESENPKRSRCIQTETQHNSKSVGIQCIIDSELDFGAGTDLAAEQLEEAKQLKLKFSRFVAENSLSYPNGKLECCICGEITAKQKSMEAHLRFHYGPSVLCTCCGRQFQHELQLRKHACDAKQYKRVPRLRCPHHLCNVRPISKLELYDHINEHSFENCYQCKLCHKLYPTYGELQQHIKLRKNCRKAQSKVRNPYKKMLAHSAQDLVCRRRVQVIYTLKGAKALRVSRLDKCVQAKPIRQCPLCLRKCSNEFKFQKHRKRCLISYCFRYKKKCYKLESKVFGVLA